MISFGAVVLILFAHFIADFVLQTDWMVRNKSKTNFPLLVHVCVYGLFLLAPAMILFNYVFVTSLIFVVVNVILHFFTDWCTSRVSSRLYAQGKLGSNTIPNLGFFSVIGFDQFLHYVCLFGTYILMI